MAVRERVEVRIFHAFLKNYIIALRMVQEKTEEPTIFLVETYRTSGDDCECSVSIKTGIPCAHMLAVLIRQSDSNYLRHFNWRWLELHKFDEELVKNRRGPRNSRRRKR